ASSFRAGRSDTSSSSASATCLALASQGSPPRVTSRSWGNVDERLDRSRIRARGRLGPGPQLGLFRPALAGVATPCPQRSQSVALAGPVVLDPSLGRGFHGRNRRLGSLRRGAVARDALACAGRVRRRDRNPRAPRLAARRGAALRSRMDWRWSRDRGPRAACRLARRSGHDAPLRRSCLGGPPPRPPPPPPRPPPGPPPAPPPPPAPR